MDNFISNELKNEIIHNYIEPSYREDIKRNLRLRNFFKKSGLTFEVLSKLFVGITSVLSFSSGIYKYEYLSFIAGTSSVVSLVLLQYASYSYRESKKINHELNDILKKLNINVIDEYDNGSNTSGSIDENNVTPIKM